MSNKRSFTLEELANITKSKLVGDPTKIIEGFNTLDIAQNNEASFLANSRYEDAMRKSKAGVICIDDITPTDENKNYLISKDPSKVFQTIVEAMINNDTKIVGYENIHPTAVIDESATIEENVTIGPYTFIDKNVTIKKNTIITSHVTISMNVKIGENCIIHPSVVVREDCIIGNRVIIQPGAIIGSCGFGYTQDKEGKFQKLHHIGNVIIEDDVEIGANTTIDKARFKSTIISKGTKIDNLVQIAHNVTVGKNNAIAAQTGIAGSSKTGNNILMGGQVGITGHIVITDNVMLATRSGVSKSLKKPGKYRGSPAIDLNEYNRQKVYERKIGKLFKELESIKKQLEESKNIS